MSNFNPETLQSTNETGVCPKVELSAIARDAAFIEAESRYLRVVGDPDSNKITELDQEWMTLSEEFRKKAVENPEFIDHYQITYTEALIEAFRTVRGNTPNTPAVKLQY